MPTLPPNPDTAARTCSSRPVCPHAAIQANSAIEIRMYSRVLRMRIHTADSPSDIIAVRQLFEEYWRSFGFTPCFQGFADEVAALPGKYAPPRGRLALAVDNDKLAGCAALRPVDTTRAEAK